MLRSRFCVCILCTALSMALALVLLLIGAQPAAADDPPARKGPVSFINDVAPILKENCFACHDAKKRSGKYDMTTFEKFMDGPGTEPIVPGKPGDSELYELIAGTGDRRMPPKKDNLSPLPKPKVDVVKAWIEQGAKL